MRKVVYRSIRGAANAAWNAFQAVNRRVPARSFQPAWSPEPLPKTHERTKPPLGYPAPHGFALPDVHTGGPRRHRRRHARAPRARGRAARRDPGRHRPARQRDLDGQDVPEARHVRGPHGQRRRVLRAARAELLRPRREDREGQAPRPRLGLDALRARRGPHGRPHEPLQHDVQPVLHGREPGRLRPRALLRGRPGDPRQRRLDQAAAADVRAVLGRRAHDLAVLPRGDALREGNRLLLGPVRDERHPLRAGAGVREGRVRGGPAARVPPVRRRRERAERAPRRREPLRREAPRARQPPRGRDRRHARHDDRELRQQRPGRRDHPVRDREHRQDQRGLLPARLLHGPRRGDRRRDAQEAALHALAPRARREGPGGHRRADARLVPALGLGPLLRPEGPPRRPRGAVGLAQVRLPPELRHRDDDARAGPRRGRPCPSRRSSTRTGSCAT